MLLEVSLDEQHYEELSMKDAFRFDGARRSLILSWRERRSARSGKPSTWNRVRTSRRAARSLSKAQSRRGRDKEHGAESTCMGHPWTCLDLMGECFFFFLAMEKYKESLFALLVDLHQRFCNHLDHHDGPKPQLCQGNWQGQGKLGTWRGRWWEGWMQGYTRISKPKTTFSRDSPMQNGDAIREKYGEAADALIAKYVRVFEPIMDKVQAETERLRSLSRKFHQRTQKSICNCQVSRWMETVCARVDARTKRTPARHNLARPRTWTKKVRGKLQRVFFGISIKPATKAQFWGTSGKFEEFRLGSSVAFALTQLTDTK